MTYTDVFGTDTLPPSEFSYTTFSFSTNATFLWSYNSSGGNALAKINEITTTSSNVSLTLPSAKDASVGEDFILRNVGSYTFSVLDANGGVVATVAPGVAKYFYLSDNTSTSGIWGVLTYGSGASSVDAAQLAGNGIKAIFSSLSQSHPIIESATVTTITDAHRAKVFNYTGGMDTLPLNAAAVLGNDFFFLLRNSGSGTLTVDPYASELIDGQLSINVQPGESALLICSGVAWFTVGLGRSVQYNFTQLVYDVTTGSPFTLTLTQASNKLITFIGSPSAGVVVNIPHVVSVYYVYNNISTSQPITIKTVNGSGTSVLQGQRAILFCDGANVISAQSAVATSNIMLTDGSVTAPSMNFSSQTNTGLYKYGADGLGISVNGSSVAQFSSAGLVFPQGIDGGAF
jgi:hypothetical protein